MAINGRSPDGQFFAICGRGVEDERLFVARLGLDE